MTKNLLRRKWFKGLVTATSISLDMLDRCINNMTMRQLAQVKADDFLEAALLPHNNPCVAFAAKALVERLAICGLIERRLLGKYRRKKNSCRETFFAIVLKMP